MADSDDLKATFEQFAGAFNARNLDAWVALWHTEWTGKPHAGRFIRKTYAARDMKTASLLFVREVTPELLRTLSGSA